MNAKKSSPKNPFIHTFYTHPKSGPEIEDWSFEIIDRDTPLHRFAPDEWQVVRRMIHTTGDFTIMGDVIFSPGVIPAAIRTLSAGSPIYVDSNMIRAGLSLERLRSASSRYSRDDVFCHIADDDVAQNAREAGLPRSIFAIRKAKSILTGGIAVFGNAPIALLELNRMILEENIRPSLIIAMPVGFVHVTESKEEILSLDIPCIALRGRRGGSPLAVSVIHALCTLTSQYKGGKGEGNE